MSLLDRVGPYRALNKDDSRPAPIRRGVRDFDVSQAVASGRLVILAQATGSIPMPMDVNDDRMAGEGVTFYQVTASGVIQVKNKKSTRDGPVGFWPSLVTASRLAVRSGIVRVTTSMKAIREP